MSRRGYRQGTGTRRYNTLQDGVLPCRKGVRLKSCFVPSYKLPHRLPGRHAQEDLLNKSEAVTHDASGSIALEGAGNSSHRGFGPKRAYALLSYGDGKDVLCATLAAALACRAVATVHYDVIIMRLGDPIEDHLIPVGVLQRGSTGSSDV